MDVRTSVIQALEETCAFRGGVDLHDISINEKKKLSFNLRHRYEYLVMETGSFSLILAADAQDEDLPTPREYLSDYRELAAIFVLPVAFLLPRLATVAYCRRLVSEQIPFLSRYGEMYVPQLMMRLQDVKKNMPFFRSPPAKLSPSTQVLLLRQFLFHDVAGLNLRQTAKLLQYAPMGIYKAKEELVACGLCEYSGTRRTSSFSFPLAPHQLWEKALPVMRTPVREERYIRISKEWNSPCIAAGVSALSRHTLLEDDSLPTMALYRYADGVDKFPAVYEEEAEARLQLWSYDPLKLIKSPLFETVDPFSLYLSLLDDPDERVQQELRKITLP